MAVSSADKNVTVDIIADPSPDADFSVILRLPKFSTNIRHEDFLKALGRLIDIAQVKSLGKLKNTNEWQVTFNNSEARNKLFIAGNITVRTKKCVVLPSGNNYVLGRVHWLPIEVQDETIKEILQNFGEVVHIAKEKISSDPDAPNSLVRFFVINLSKHCTLADIPHFLFINHYEGLVVVKGRDPICLECHNVGHRKFECPARKQWKVSKKPKSKEKSAVPVDTENRSNAVSKAKASVPLLTEPKSKNQTASASTTRTRRISTLTDALQDLIIRADRENNHLLTDGEKSATATNLPGPSTATCTASGTGNATGGRKTRKKRKKKANINETYNLISAEANSNDTFGSGQHSPKGSLDSGIAVNGNSTLVNVSDSVSEFPNNTWDVPVQVNELEASSNVNTTPAPSNLNQKKKKKNKKKTGASQIPGLTHP